MLAVHTAGPGRLCTPPKASVRTHLFEFTLPKTCWLGEPREPPLQVRSYSEPPDEPHATPCLAVHTPVSCPDDARRENTWQRASEEFTPPQFCARRFLTLRERATESHVRSPDVAQAVPGRQNQQDEAPPSC